MRSTPVHDLENWLRRNGFDRSVQDVADESGEEVYAESVGADSPVVRADAREETVEDDTDSRSHVNAFIERLNPANFRPKFSNTACKSSPTTFPPPVRQLAHRDAHSSGPFSASNASSLRLPPLPPPTVMIGIPKRFVPLVEFFRMKGYQRVRRTDIGVQIQSALQVRTFKNYTREAEKLGIVKLGIGGDFPQGWIALAVCLPDAMPPTSSPSTAASSPSGRPLLSQIQLEPIHPIEQFKYQVHQTQIFIGKVPDRSVQDEDLLRADLRTLLSPYFKSSAIESIKIRHSSSAKCRLAFVRLDPRSDVGSVLECTKVLRERGTPLMRDEAPVTVEWNASYLVEHNRGSSTTPSTHRRRSRSPDRRRSLLPDRRLSLDAAVQTRAPAVPGKCNSSS